MSANHAYQEQYPLLSHPALPLKDDVHLQHQIKLKQWEPENSRRPPNISNQEWEDFRNHVFKWHQQGLTKKDILNNLGAWEFRPTMNQLVSRMKIWNLQNSTRLKTTTISDLPAWGEKAALPKSSSLGATRYLELSSPTAEIANGPFGDSVTWDFASPGRWICNHSSREDSREQTTSPLNLADELMATSSGFQKNSMLETTLDNTVARFGMLDMARSQADVDMSASSDLATTSQDNGPSERSSASSVQQSRSSSMSQDSSQRPGGALSLMSDRSSWRFSKVTGLPSEPHSVNSFRTSITRAAEGRPSSDLRYYPRVPAKKFFRKGRVFAISRLNGKYSFGEDRDHDLDLMVAEEIDRLQFHTCRLVVAQEGALYSSCVPITTYGGRGLRRNRLTKDEIDAHAIIYMNVSGAEPQYLPEESSSIKRAIAVKPASHDQRLHVASRINFGRVHNIPHEASVMNVGKVEEAAIPYLSQYFRMHAQRG